MNLRNKFTHLFRELLEYLILIFNISSLIILFVKFEEFSNVFIRSNYQFISENNEIILIFIIILLFISFVFIFFKKTKLFSSFIILLFSSSYGFYLYYNLYVLYDSCSCQSLFSFISLKENFQISLIFVLICIIYLIFFFGDRIKPTRQTL